MESTKVVDIISSEGKDEAQTKVPIPHEMYKMVCTIGWEKLSPVLTCLLVITSCITAPRLYESALRS